MDIRRLIAPLVLAPFMAAAQSWIQIDLNEAGPGAGGGTWNVVSTPTSSVGYLVDTDGVATPATLAISAGWQDSTYFGAKGAYATTVFGNSADDYFFIRSKENGYTNGTITVSGLSNGVPYAVQLASSMADSSQSRVADFRVNGVFGTSTPSGQNFDSRLDGYYAGSIIMWAPAYPVGGQFVISIVRRSTVAEATASLNAIRIGPVGDVPPAPVLTRARALSDTELDVAWTGDFAEGTTFTVTCSSGALTRTLNVGTVRSTWVTGLMPSTTYAVRVAAVLMTVPGASSETVSVTTQAPPPAGKKYEIDFNTVTSAANWICLAAPTPQTSGGLSFAFSNFQDSSAGGHAGTFSGSLFATAASDYFFVNNASTGLTGTLTVSGLPNKAYRAQLCSSASSSATTRTADYRVNGEFSPLSPTGQQYNSNVSGYGAALLMTWPSVKPVNGAITVTVQTASGTYYGILNGLRLVELPPEGTLILLR